jgi:hypothetical protein
MPLPGIGSAFVNISLQSDVKKLILKLVLLLNKPCTLWLPWWLRPPETSIVECVWLSHLLVMFTFTPPTLHVLWESNTIKNNAADFHPSETRQLFFSSPFLKEPYQSPVAC